MSSDKITVTKIVPPPTATEYRLELILSAQEAQELLQIGHNIGGDPVRSLAGVLRYIAYALQRAGLAPTNRVPFERLGISTYMKEYAT